MGRFFDTRRLITNGRLEFCGFVVCSEEEPNVCLVVIGADTTEEGDTVLWSQFLNQTSSVNTYSHGRGKKTNVGKTPIFLQPLMLAQNFGIRSACGVLLEALSQKVIKERRDRFRNGGFGILHYTEHDCSHDVSVPT